MESTLQMAISLGISYFNETTTCIRIICIHSCLLGTLVNFLVWLAHIVCESSAGVAKGGVGGVDGARLEADQ